jgi:hypothetical protein
LAEVLSKMPPALIVVDDPEAAAQSVAPIGFGAPEDADAPAFLASENTGGFAPLSIETDTARAPASAASPRRRPGVPARKRKPKNPIVEGLKIVLGGVAGLAIAQVILWWLGSSQSWPKQRADMFQLAPKVARFAPWIVPERYQSERPARDAAASEQGAGAVAMGDSETMGPQEFPERTFVDPNAGGGTDRTEQPNSGAKKKSSRPTGRIGPGGATAGTRSTAEPDIDITQIPLDDSSLDDLNLNADMMTDDEPIEDPVVMPVEEPEQPAMNEPKAAAEPLPKAPRTTAAELRSAVEDARTAFEALKASDEDDIRPLLRQTYPVLAKLGETAAFAASRGAEWEAANELLQTVIAEEDKLSMLGRVGGGWLKAPARDNNGVLLVGTVKQVRKQGGYHVIELMIPGSDQAVAVYSDTGPRADYPPDSQLVVLGALISNPSSELDGYDGDATYVVWQGLAEQPAAP